jgi:nitronate monooxygenase
MGTATTVREAVENEEAGMDIVVVQGSEAGGHRGNFIDGYQESLVGLMSLIPQVVDNVSIPVVAAGGIMDGRGLMASICLGAKGVQMGTAFLTCVESGAHKVHKEAILNANEDQTVLTRSFSGKWARGIINKFILEMQNHETLLPDFPVQNTLTQDIRKTSAAQNNQDFMSLWSGQSPRLAKSQTVESLIKKIIVEAKKINLDI